MANFVFLAPQYLVLLYIRFGVVTKEGSLSTFCPVEVQLTGKGDRIRVFELSTLQKQMLRSAPPASSWFPPVHCKTRAA